MATVTDVAVSRGWEDAGSHEFLDVLWIQPLHTLFYQDEGTGYTESQQSLFPHALVASLDCCRSAELLVVFWRGDFDRLDQLLEQSQRLRQASGAADPALLSGNNTLSTVQIQDEGPPTDFQDAISTSRSATPTIQRSSDHPTAPAHYESADTTSPMIGQQALDSLTMPLQEHASSESSASIIWTPHPQPTLSSTPFSCSPAVTTVMSDVTITSGAQATSTLPPAPAEVTTPEATASSRDAITEAASWDSQAHEAQSNADKDSIELWNLRTSRSTQVQTQALEVEEGQGHTPSFTPATLNSSTSDDAVAATTPTGGPPAVGETVCYSCYSDHWAVCSYAIFRWYTATVVQSQKPQ